MTRSDVLCWILILSVALASCPLADAQRYTTIMDRAQHDEVMCYNGNWVPMDQLVLGTEQWPYLMTETPSYYDLTCGEDVIRLYKSATTEVQFGLHEVSQNITITPSKLRAAKTSESKAISSKEVDLFQYDYISKSRNEAKQENGKLVCGKWTYDTGITSTVDASIKIDADNKIKLVLPSEIDDKKALKVATHTWTIEGSTQTVSDTMEFPEIDTSILSGLNVSLEFQEYEIPQRDHLVGEWLFSESRNYSDSSGNGNDGTPSNIEWEQTERGLKPNFNMSYINAGHDVSLCPETEMTISFWEYLTDETPYHTGLIVKYIYNSRQDYIIKHGSNNREINFCISPNDTASTKVSSNSLVPVSTWTHVLCVWKSNDSMAIYINGELDNIITENVPEHIQGTSRDLWFGKYYLSYYHAGNLDDILIYNTALISPEVLDLYNASLPLHPVNIASNAANLTWYANTTGQQSVPYATGSNITNLTFGLANPVNVNGSLFNVTATRPFEITLYAGSDYYVSPGSDISATLATMNEYDTLYFGAGTYNNLHLIVPHEHMTFASHNGTVLFDGGDDTGTGIYAINKNGTTISGIDLEDYTTGIYVTGDYNNLTIEDVDMTSLAGRGVVLDSASGTHTVKDVSISNLSASFLGGESVKLASYITGCENIFVSNAETTNTSGTASIYIQETTNCQLSNITVYNTTADGINWGTRTRDSIANDITIRMAGWHGFGVQVSASEGDPYTFDKRIDNVTISNFSISEFGHNGIDWQTGAHNSTARDGKIFNDTIDLHASQTHLNCSHITMENIEIYDVWRGLSFKQPNSWAYNVTIHDVTNDAVQLLSENCSYSGNIYDCTGSTAILVGELVGGGVYEIGNNATIHNVSLTDAGKIIWQSGVTGQTLRDLQTTAEMELYGGTQVYMHYPEGRIFTGSPTYGTSGSYETLTDWTLSRTPRNGAALPENGPITLTYTFNSTHHIFSTSSTTSSNPVTYRVYDLYPNSTYNITVDDVYQTTVTIPENGTALYKYAGNFTSSHDVAFVFNSSGGYEPPSGTWYKGILITVANNVLSYLNADETSTEITDWFALLVDGVSGYLDVISENFNTGGVPDTLTTIGSGNQVSGGELLLDTTYHEGVILDYECAGKRTMEFNYVGDGNSNKIHIYVETTEDGLTGSYIDITTKNWATNMGGSNAVGGDGAEYFTDGAPIKVEVTDTRVKLWEDSTYVGYWDGSFDDGYFAVVTGASGDQIGMDNLVLNTAVNPSVDVYVDHFDSSGGNFTLSNMTSVDAVNISVKQTDTSYNYTLSHENGTSISSLDGNGNTIWYNVTLSAGNYTIDRQSDQESIVDPGFVAFTGFAGVLFAIASWLNQRRRRW